MAELKGEWIHFQGDNSVSLKKKGLSKRKEFAPLKGIFFPCTLQPPYNTVCYNMVLDIIRFKDGSQKCIDYVEK